MSGALARDNATKIARARFTMIFGADMMGAASRSRGEKRDGTNSLGSATRGIGRTSSPAPSWRDPMRRLPRTGVQPRPEWPDS